MQSLIFHICTVFFSLWRYNLLLAAVYSFVQNLAYSHPETNQARKERTC